MDWRLDQLESTFYQPEGSGVRWLDHLKQGLWSAGLAGKWPFRIGLAGQEECLIWDGRAFFRRPCRPEKVTRVTVSHRAWERSWRSVMGLEAARSNAAILLELTESAYMSPIPVAVDGRRLDALQACPSHGLSG